MQNNLTKSELKNKIENLEKYFSKYKKQDAIKKLEEIKEKLDNQEYKIAVVANMSSGKSTFISVISSAKPKIADYPFTTLVPNLGVVTKPSGDGFVVADIPGLIEGASEGIGLGHEFLRHVERCRFLVGISQFRQNFIAYVDARRSEY